MNLPEGYTLDQTPSPGTVTPPAGFALDNRGLSGKKSDLHSLIQTEAKSAGVDPELAFNLVKTESRLNPRAVSPKGAKGLTQLMPGTSKDMGVNDPFDPGQNLRGGFGYFKKLLDKYNGNAQFAAAAYNMGPKGFDDWRHGKRSMPLETRKYVRKVTGQDIEGGGTISMDRTTTGQRIARSVEPYTRTALPFAGSVAGGILAAPANLGAPGVAEAVGVGIGGAMGNQLNRSLRKYAYGEEDQTPISNAVKDFATTAMGGAIAPTLPTIQAVGRAEGSILGPAEGTAARKLLSQETEVPLTPAQLGRRKSSAYLEGQLRHNMFSSDTAQDFDSAQYQKLTTYGRKVQDQGFGGKGMGAASAGDEATNRAWDRYQAFQRRASKIYESVPVAPETPIETNKFAEVAKEHSEELGKMSSPAIRRILGIAGKGEIPALTSESAIVDKYGKPVKTETPAKPAYTWQELQDDLSTLGKEINKTSDYNRKRILRNLIDAGREDIAAFGEKSDNPKIKHTLDIAHEYYKHGEKAFGPAREGVDLPGVKTFREPQIKNMMKNQSPEDLVKKFFKPGENVSDIRRLKAAAGVKGFQELKRVWLEGLLTSGEDQAFSHNKFATAYDKYRRGGNLDVMLTKREREGLDKLYNISRAIQWSERVGGNPSQSGIFTLNSVRKMITHPVWTTLEAIGSKNLAKNYFENPEFQAKLVEGLKVPQTSQRAKAIAHSLAIMAGVKLREPNEPENKSSKPAKPE